MVRPKKVLACWNIKWGKSHEKTAFFEKKRDSIGDHFMQYNYINRLGLNSQLHVHRRNRSITTIWNVSKIKLLIAFFQKYSSVGLIGKV